MAVIDNSVQSKCLRIKVDSVQQSRWAQTYVVLTKRLLQKKNCSVPFGHEPRMATSGVLAHSTPAPWSIFSTTDRQDNRGSDVQYLKTSFSQYGSRLSSLVILYDNIIQKFCGLMTQHHLGLLVYNKIEFDNNVPRLRQTWQAVAVVSRSSESLKLASCTWLPAIWDWRVSNVNSLASVPACST